MIDLAIKHSSELNSKLYDTWYDPYYQYFYGQRARFEVDSRDMLDRNEVYLNRSFVSMNSKEEIIGYIGYSVDTSLGLAYGFELLSFDKTESGIWIFSTDAYSIFKDLFTKYNLNTVEFSVYIGNPIEPSYDKLCERMGGRVLCIQNKRGVLMDGTLVDRKLYQITKEEFFMKNRSKHFQQIDKGEG